MQMNEEKKHLRGLRLLLVEDNISNQKVAMRYLQKWEIEADLAENGIICLEKINQQNYDMILMDLQMPEMDGYKATEEIRKREEPKFKEIPIIALTASALLDTKLKVQQAGMTDYISKPFVPAELFQIIQKYYKKK
jgi:CheY-like chemotaxis protein